MWDEIRKRGLPADGALLVVDILKQRLQLIQDGHVEKDYSISTSRFGMGSAAGSHRTPPGLHAVAERIGAGAAPGAVFKDRRATGEILPETAWRGGGASDQILTRILWLSGLEDGINRRSGHDSHERYIYLHGTNHEEQLGRPASAGCIRLGNRDMLDLFERTKDKTTWVWIG